MPRNVAGIYTLPNPPVAPDTTIESVDENTTRDDIASELTNSLDRNGRGGMLAPFRIADGTMATPGLAFLNDPNCGIWRSAADVWHVVAGGANQLQFSLNGTLLENPLALGAFGVSRTGAAGSGLSFDAANIATFTANALGDVLLFTAPTGNIGRLYADADKIGLFDGANANGRGVWISEATNSISLMVLNAGSPVGRVTIANTNPVLSAQGNIASSDAITAVNAVTALEFRTTTTPGSPPVVAAGVGALWSTSAGGCALKGNGSLYDFTVVNRLDQIALIVPTGTKGIQVFGASAIISADAANALLIQTSHAAPFGMRCSFTGAAPNNAVQYFAVFNDTVGNKMVLYSNGGIHNFSANNVNLSDARAKTLSDAYMPSARGKLRALEIYLGRYNDESGPDHPMLTAQQVREVFPELVVPFADTDMLGVKEHGLWMHHLKATQEHDDEIEALKARITALENA